MLAQYSLWSCCSSSTSIKSLSILASSAKPRTIRIVFPHRTVIKLRRAHSVSNGEAISDENDSRREETYNYAGTRLEETVDTSSKLRLDSWISSRIHGISRARVQSSIKSGLVCVNGQIVDKVSHNVRSGDKVDCLIAELQPLRAIPEDIPLDIVYEDEHVLVVNKPPHMVVHPAPGNPTGTLVNAILHHCGLPTPAPFSDEGILLDEEDVPNDDELCSSPRGASIRPGIVHRLDKGTSGLLVVAKDEHSHAHLSDQFKQRSIHRVYVSLTCGVPSPTTGRIEVPIGRDLNNRIRMTAVPGSSNREQARYAASRYKVTEILAGGGAAIVEWRLETGRTHQIRAHAKYIGIPLLGDDIYGGTKNFALSLLRPRTPPSFHGQISQLLSELERPCLHALALGFTHPRTTETLNFSTPTPPDFTEILSQLRKIGTEKEQLNKAFIPSDCSDGLSTRKEIRQFLKVGCLLAYEYNYEPLTIPRITFRCQNFYGRC